MQGMVALVFLVGILCAQFYSLPYVYAIRVRRRFFTLFGAT